MSIPALKNKIAAISMVKDEADIIELFIKINAKFIDHFFIVDHSSTDKTLDILVKLKNSGFPITVLTYTEIQYNQVFVTNSLLKIATDSDEYEFIIPLDADEFIYNPNKEDLLETLRSEISTDSCGLMKWVNYAPISNDYFSFENPLFHLFRKRSSEPIQFYKVIIPNELAKIGSTTMGNHQFLINGNNSNYSLVTPFLQHCPVRSSEQIIAKSIIGSHRFSLKNDRKPGEGFHWDVITEKIRSINYQLDDKSLMKIAIHYAISKDESDDDIHLLLDSERIGSSNEKIELKDFAKINYVRNFDNFAKDLCSKIKSQQSN